MQLPGYITQMPDYKMEIKFNASFHKRYQKLNPKIKKAFQNRLELFIQNPRQPLLRDHPLAGKMQGHRAFSITGDIRVVYYIHKDTAYFVDIGTHNQVYGR